MVADTKVADAARPDDLPRAWDPALAGRLRLPQTRPGWDVGPERRLDDGRSMARMLVIGGIGLAVVAVGAALLRAARSRGR